jgi:beta-galactosidase GanA
MPRSRLVTALAALALAIAVTAGPAVAAPAGPSAGAATPAAPAARHTVGYDHYSLLVDGKRVVLWSGEFHYFRLPSPALWRDVLEKIRAGGFNGVSLYFDWAYHSPAPGVYDFTGVRDVDLLLRMAEQLGLYVVARPGPYINAEVTGGGFPAWLTQVPGRARSGAPGYTAAYRQWQSRIDAIIARHQVTRGGAVIAYNAENEYGAAVDPVYMQQLQAAARADGIDVPIVHNNCCGGNLPNWSSGPGAVQIAGVDDYPQSFECQTPDVWGSWGEGVTRRLRDDAPVYAAEYQAGAIDVNSAGYEACRALTGPGYMKVFYKSNVVSSGATMFGYYMAYGGTSWGFLPQPNDVGSSYDYGAAITESRQLTPKYDEFKRQGYFMTTVAPLAKTDAVAPPAGGAGLHLEARANPDTGTHVLLVRAPDRGTAVDVVSTVDWSTPDGRYQVPVQLHGRDAKILLAGYDLGGQRLVLSTSELLTHVPDGDRDVAVLYGRSGEPGRTVLRYGSRPSVRVLAGSAAASWDPARGDLTLNYVHSGLTRVLVAGGGRRPLLLLLGTDGTAASFWRLPTAAGPVLVRGTDLLRTADRSPGTLALAADTTARESIEVLTAAGVRRLTVNGAAVPVRRTASGSLVGTLPGPGPVSLPSISWRADTAGAPEASPSFDDRVWRAADHTATTSPYLPKTLPVLYADDYGYHYGDVWYRGHFTATGAETTVDLNAITGKRGVYLVWLNGRYLGSAAGGVQADSDPPVDADPGPGHFAVPAGLLRAGRRATLSVLVTNMGHNDDWIADDLRFKQPRGLVAASVAGAGAISWRIQGARGGEQLTDPARGPLNTGGLFGERAGWQLPAFHDAGWARASTAAPLAPGVTWLRGTARLDLPTDQDTPVVLRFGAPPTASWRAQIFLNGWNVGQYLGSLGAQHDFALPAGLLRTRGPNTIALAVTATTAVPTGLGPVTLAALDTARGGVPIWPVAAPDR